MPDFRFRLILAWWDDLTEKQRDEMHMDAVLGVMLAEALARDWSYIADIEPRIIGGG